MTLAVLMNLGFAASEAGAETVTEERQDGKILITYLKMGRKIVRV